MIFTKNNPNRNRRFGSLGKKRFIYSKKTYANPFFRHKKTRLIRPDGFLSNQLKLIIFATLIIIIILSWLIFFSTLFKINRIEISGAEENMAKEIETLAHKLGDNQLLGKNNLLLYDKAELTRVLNDKYYLQNLKIEKKILHTLKITLTEKSQTAVWLEGDKYFYLDNDGKTINQVDPLNINSRDLPLIENLTGIGIEERQANINQLTVTYLLGLFNEFKDNRHGFEIEKFILDRDVNTIKLAVLLGPKIYFNSKEAIADQTAKLDLIIKEKSQDSLKTKEYIDLRYGNNVYIK